MLLIPPSGTNCHTSDHYPSSMTFFMGDPKPQKHLYRGLCQALFRLRPLLSYDFLLRDRVRPWCGGACLAGRPPICASFASLFLLVQAVVHCGPLSMVIWWSHLSAADNADPFFFCGWSNNLEWTFNRA